MLSILVVDDEIPMRDLVAQMIARRETEFQVVGVAGDGEQALELVRQTRPDIVITDIYMPVCGGIEFLQRAQAEGLRFKTIIISGHDEFECAKQAILLGVTDYLLKPFLPSELFDVMEKIRTEMEHQRMLEQNMAALRSLVDQQQLLLGEKLYAQLARGTLRSEPPKGSREAELFDFGAKFFCAGYSCDRRMNGHPVWDAGRDEELMSLLSEYFNSSITLHSARMNETQTALLFSGSGESEETFLLNLRSGLSRCQASLKRHFDIQLRCAIGRPRRDWRQLCDSYEEARAAWRLQMKTEQMLIVYGENAAKPNDETGDATKQIRQLKTNILFEIGMGSREKALERLDALMKCYAALSSKKSDYIFISASELVYAISGELEERCGTVDDTMLSEIEGARQKVEFSSLMEMKDALERFVSACCLWVQERNDAGRGVHLIEQVTSLINAQLDNPELSLELVAGRFNFSPHYIRQIFKQHHGEAFSDYVIRKRMERAGTLLRTSGMLVQDVALACGYANQRYFASSFKKYYGQTPTDFKQALEQKKQKKTEQ